MRSFDLAVQPRRRRPDVHVLDAFVEHVPVEPGLELGAVVRLDHLDPEGELLEDVVNELDRCDLVEAIVDSQDPEPGAIVDRRELVVLLPSSGQGSNELDVDLDAMTWLGLLVALPAVLVALVALGARQPAHAQALEDPPDPGRADLDLVVALEVHGDLVRPEVVVLAEVDDLADDLLLRRLGAQVRPRGSIPQADDAQLLVPAEPHVVALPGDAVVPTCQGDVAADLLGMADDRQPSSRVSGEFSLGHLGLLSVWGPKCQQPPSVLDRGRHPDGRRRFGLVPFGRPIRVARPTNRLVGKSDSFNPSRRMDLPACG